MRRSIGLLLAVCALLAGCGGGGGGGGGGGQTGTVVGRVLDVNTGGPANPQATVQAGGNSTSTAVSDGSFALQAPEGTTSILVDTNGPNGVWNFAIPSVVGTVDAGDLWVGPQRVTVTGRVISAANGSPVAGAAVSFAGRKATSGADGVFNLAEVAYSNATQTAFWGIVGSILANGFFKQDFSASPNVAAGGVVNLGDILLTPTSDDDPPPLPFNISGRVLPINQAPGTIVTLKDNGGTAVRVFNVGTTGTYTFWVAPGNYTVEYQNGVLSAPTQSVTVTAVDETVQVPDVTLG